MQSLEGKVGTCVPNVTAIVRRFVRPGPDGPVDSGQSIATILVGPNRGSQLVKEGCESQLGFDNRVEAFKNGVRPSGSPIMKPTDSTDRQVQIEVTQEMIKAGLEELREHSFGENVEYLLEEVYRAMAYSSPELQQ